MKDNDTRNLREDLKTMVDLIIEFKDKVESLHPHCSAFILMLPKLIDTTVIHV